MALPASGAISLSDFNTELGITAGTTISMNDAGVGGLLGLASGAEASFSDYYGASSIVDIALTIAANTNNYNIFSSKGGTYVAGKSNVTLTINSGVSIGSTSASAAALDTGTGWASGDTITIVNNGTVVGKGGNGGNGATARLNSSSITSYTSEIHAGNGEDGGDAFRAQFATTITNNGTFAGAGGGGGGAASSTYYDSKFNSNDVTGGGGGGGGAGTNAGSGGSAGRGKNYWQSNTFYSSNRVATSASSGTATTGGVGGGSVSSSTGYNLGILAGAGGALGSAGVAGQAPGVYRGGLVPGTTNGTGGAAGNYATGNSNITWSTTGTRIGGVS
jgi:hypothetical protein